MNAGGNQALLPAGLRDVLAPDAAFEAAIVARLMGELAAFGYERVKPPLIEFEDSLLSGPGAALAAQTFRLMDPVSQRMMGLRADMTVQVARIAATRLRNAPRPLRLCYAGQVLRVKGSNLRPERQFGQVGAELIGTPSAHADAEIVVLAAGALAAVGAAHLSVDLTLPTLVPSVAAGLGFAPAAAAALAVALDRKDAAAVAALAGDHAPLFAALLAAAGPAERAVARLQKLDLPEAAAAERARLVEVVGLVRAAAPQLLLTVDPVENRGLEYHTGVSFALFARRVRSELGRGGRYLTGASGESSTGFSVYLDSLLRALPEPAAAPRLFLPLGTEPASAAALRAEGWVTVAGLTPAAEPRAEARRLGCSHWYDAGAIAPLDGTDRG
jgi:ATP phosphoribosyltransferase regulatory subunit